MNITISPLQPEHIPAVCTIANQQLGKGYLDQHQLSSPSLHTLVALIDQQVVGFVTWETPQTESLQLNMGRLYSALPGEYRRTQRLGKIGSLAVAGAWQGQGIGRHLLSVALNALQQSVQKVFLLGWRSTAGINVQPLAEGAGFVAVGSIPDYWTEASREAGYACPVCGDPPCHCSAVLFCRSL